jgi:hypothetical protein
MLRKKTILPLCLLCFVFAQPVLSEDISPAEQLPDGSVILSPQALNSIDNNLTLLETNLTRQRQLSLTLTSELSAAETSLTMLKGLYNEQAALIGSLRIQWTLIAERLQESDQSLAWTMEEAAELETAYGRLEWKNRALTWALVIAGALAGGGIAAAIIF